MGFWIFTLLLMFGVSAFMVCRVRVRVRARARARIQARASAMV